MAPLVTVRLTPDALHLEVLLGPGGLSTPTAALVPLIQEESARLNVHLPLTVRDLEARLRSCRRGDWVTLLSGTAPAAPADSRVELLAPVPVLTERGRIQGARHAVRAGAPLARLRRGAPGTPGHDLLGRELPARPAREARLPRGANTRISDDGATLLAACDGEVVLRHLLIHVAPMMIYEGDLTEQDGPVVSQTGLFVRGSVRGGRIAARDDVYIQGDVQEARIESESGGITVEGSVLGSERRRCALRAPLDIHCGNLLHADVEAGGDVRLLAEARYSTLRAAHNLYLRHSMEKSLLETQVHIGGGVLPALDDPAQLVALPAERQHFRVPTALPAAIALHGLPPLRFQPCTITDLSTSGARCRLSAGDMHAGNVHASEMHAGTIVQLKVALPGSEEPMLAVARLSRRVAPDLMGLAFLQMARRDQQRLTEYCLRLLMERKQAKLARREDRQGR